MTAGHERAIRSILKGNLLLDPFFYLKRNFIFVERFYKFILPQKIFNMMFQVPLISFPSEIFTVNEAEISIKAPYNEILKEFFDIA